MNAPTRNGIDLAKQVFQVHGIDEHGKVLVKKQLRREQMAAFFVNLPPGLVGMAACGSAHQWAGRLQAMGHTVRLLVFPMPALERVLCRVTQLPNDR